MSNSIEKQDTVIPSASDTELAKQASRVIAANRPTELRVLVDSQELVLPKAATQLIHHLLNEMAMGNAVTIIPIHAELTTQEAATFLNVSRPYLVGLLTEGKIAHHMVGTHRRVHFRDLETFRKKQEQERLAVMEELAAESQKLGMGY